MQAAGAAGNTPLYTLQLFKWFDRYRPYKQAAPFMQAVCMLSTCMHLQGPGGSNNNGSTSEL